MAMKRPGERQRLMLELSSATSNWMLGPEEAFDFVFEMKCLVLSEYWFTRWQGVLLAIEECLGQWVDPGEETGEDDLSLGLTLGQALCGEHPGALVR